MTETEMKISVDCGWSQFDGSLDNTVFFSTEGPEIESHPLFLTPSEGSGPCEITLKFEGSLCEVSSVYVRSTARIFELYTKSEICADNEYVCTARGELVMQNDDLNCVRETINKDDDSSYGICIGNLSKSSLHSSIENGTDSFLNVDDCDRESSSYPSQLDSFHGNTDETLRNMSQDSIRDSEETAKNESPCSDEDNWVEVKLSGSLVVDSPGKSGRMSQLQSLGEGKAVHESEISVKHSAGKASENYCIDLDQHEIKSPMGAPFHQHATEENSSTIGVSSSLIGNNVDAKAKADEKSVSSSGNRFLKEALYEASVEIVNATPCVSLTIRLLSLQDKSFVEIDAICIDGLRTSAVKDETENISLSSSNLHGSPFGGSLLAMLIPSMLQMSRGGLTQSQDELLYSVRRDKSMSQIASSESEPSSSSHQTIPSNRLLVKDMEALIGGNSSSDKLPGKRALAELSLLQGKLSPFLEKVGENLELSKNNSKDTVQNTPSLGPIDICLGKGQPNEIEGENSYMGGMTGVNQNFKYPMDGLYSEEHNKQYCPEQLESNKIDNCLCMKINGESMFEHICKHMDRLEALCMRIEDYVHRSLYTFERRLQIIESCQMQQNHSLLTKMESDTVHSDFLGVSNSFYSSVSDMEILNNGKHKSVLDTHKLSCAEVTPLVSVPRACLVSSADCSPLCAIVSPTTLPSDTSCMDISKDLESQKIDLLKSGFNKASEVALHESASRTLDQQELSKEEYFGDNDSHSAEHIGAYAGSEVSRKPIIEHQIEFTPNKTKPSLEEALASALSAFSVSVHPAQEETICTLTEMPPGSSQIDSADDKEGSGNDEIFSLQAETTGLCTAIPRGSSELDNLGDEVCYHDDTVFYIFEGVRYISQESMDSVPYSSFKGSKDVKQTIDRRRNITDAQDCLALTIKQSCNPGTEMVIDHEKETMLLENENLHRLHDSEMPLAKNVFGTVHLNQTASSCEREENLEDCQEQLLPLQGYDFEASQLCPKPTKFVIEKDQNLVEDKYSSFSPLSGSSKSRVSRIKGIITSLEMGEKQGEITVGSDRSMEPHDKHAPRKLQSDSSSLLDVFFTTSNAFETNLSLESLLCDHIPEQGRETVSLQKTTEVEISNFPEPKRPHGLFFVEDEDLGEFIIPGTSTLFSSVTAGSTSIQGVIPGVSPGFESLL